MQPGANELKIEPRYFQQGPVRVYYQVAGAGEPLVLVHGLSGSTRWWARNISALATQYHVHVVDLIGFGRNRDGQSFVLSEAAKHLARWMDGVGIERASVIGHSMGGFIAADLAADFPHKVERLVLVDAAALPFEHNRLQQAVGLVRGLGYIPVGFLPVLVTDAYRAGPITLLKAARELLTTDIRRKLTQIHAPTLVVWGEHDTIVPLEIGKQLERCLSNGELMVIKGAGHNPMWDRPGSFNRSVMSFLAAARSERRRDAAPEAVA